MPTLTPKPGDAVESIDTPALIVDLDILDQNIDRILTVIRNTGVSWRPHCKTHKSADLAKILIARGAIGITCSKLSEAAVMVDAGIGDILIANQIASPSKIARLMSLRQRADIAVCVDNFDNALALSSAAQQAGVSLRVLIEVDTGTRRAGVLPGEPVLQLARRIQHLPGIDLAGVMTWEGHTTQIVPEESKRAAIEEAIGALTASARLCRAEGILMRIVSCGGTGTYLTTCNVPGVTEVQVGGGILGDVRYQTKYHVDVFYALKLVATVTSRPTAKRVIVDAGKKSLSCDAGTPAPVGLPQIASISFSAEHGKIELEEPSAVPAVGDRVEIVPGYADTTVHLHRQLYGVRNGRIETVWPLREDSRLL